MMQRWIKYSFTIESCMEWANMLHMIAEFSNHIIMNKPGPDKGHNLDSMNWHSCTPCVSVMGHLWNDKDLWHGRPGFSGFLQTYTHFCREFLKNSNTWSWWSSIKQLHFFWICPSLSSFSTKAKCTSYQLYFLTLV